MILVAVIFVPQAMAAKNNTMDISSEGVEFVKKYEGFSQKPYLDSGTWRIGYGTKCTSNDYPYGITEEEATELLYEALEEYVDKVNSYVSTYDIELQQNQFDALVSFTYNLGIGWSGSDYKFSSYLIDGLENYSDLEILDAFVVWCHVGKTVDKGLLNRRMAEARLLIYGDYDGTASPNFTYVVFDAKGGSMSSDVKCFYKGDTYEAMPVPEKEDYVFAGWFDDSNKTVRDGVTITEPLWLTAKWFIDVDLPFTDVADGAWYHGYVGELYSEGVINGMSSTVFAPQGSVTYGQAFKLIMLATGMEPTEEPGEGQNWAQAYLNMAIDEGIVDNGFCRDLNAVISRADIARLAAGAMGLKTSNTSKTPFVDTSDKNVAALYGAGIVEGTTEKNGSVYYYPDSSITRAEISTIIWRILSYTKDNTHYGQIQYGAYLINIMPTVKKYTYNDDNYYTDNGFRYYRGKDTYVGIDVSVHQGTIDWQKVADAGVHFAMIRVGGRGYGKEGKMYDDVNFEKNIKGAIDAGVNVGIYYFSQAITVAEAREEAQYVLDKISGYDISYPVVFDWERIGGSDARTYGLETDQLCRIADTFCSMVEDAGYKAMIYFNSYCGYIKYDLSKLNQYDFWFARYNSVPGFYYDFQMWQYSDKGSVDGISGNVDLDISFVDYAAQ